MGTTGKPPLGLMPRQLWVVQRKAALARAIGRYIIAYDEAGATGKETYDLMYQIEVWALELTSLIH